MSDTAKVEQEFATAVHHHRTGNFSEAEKLYRKILKIYPEHPDTLHLLGVVLYQNGKSSSAIPLISKAIQIDPDKAAYYVNLGDAFSQMGKEMSAIEQYKKALKIQPHNSEALWGMGASFHKKGNFKKEIDCYDKGLKYEPGNAKFMGQMVWAMRDSCKWEGVLEMEEKVRRVIKKQIKEKNPLSIKPAQSLHIFPSLKNQYEFAHRYATQNFRSVTANANRLGFKFNKKEKKKIKIGYVFANYKTHIVDDILPCHDKNSFEILLYEIKGKEEDIANKIYEDDIDILIDVMGYNIGARPNIVALKPAPIQVNFLGHQGTMGADFMDYVIVDHEIASNKDSRFFEEKPIFMPHTYVAVTRKNVSYEEVSRKKYNLPEDKFVFCCFAKPRKIDARIFDVWVDILKEKQDSVLWLHSDNEFVKENLWKEALKRGIEKERIIFASRVSKEEHLARHRLADLFLDCFNINARGAVINAISVGVPVITKYGDSVISRSSASVLKAAEMPELVAKTDEEYKNKAILFATNKDELSDIKKKLKEKQKTAPLFDTKRYVKNLEEGLKQAWKKYLAGKKPAIIDIREN